MARTRAQTTRTSLKIARMAFVAFASLLLSAVPLAAHHSATCAEAGYLPHRFSRSRGFDNPFVWCVLISWRVSITFGFALCGNRRNLRPPPSAAMGRRRAEWDRSFIVKYTRLADSNSSVSLTPTAGCGPYSRCDRRTRPSRGWSSCQSTCGDCVSTAPASCTRPTAPCAD